MSCLGGYVSKEQCDNFLVSDDGCFFPMLAIDFSGSIAINTLPEEVLQEISERLTKAIEKAMVNIRIK